MKVFLFILLFGLATLPIVAQFDTYSYFNNKLTTDSLKRAISQSKEDTNKVHLYVKLATKYTYTFPDSNLLYNSKGIELARKLEFKIGEILALAMMGEALLYKGNYTKAMELKLESLHKAEKLNDPELLAWANFRLSALYLSSGDYRKALFYLNKAKDHKRLFDTSKKHILRMIGECYLHLNQLDSAEYNITQAYEIDRNDTTHIGMIFYSMGALYEKKGEYAKSLHFYRKMYQFFGHADPGMASLFNKMGMQDSAIYYAKKILAEPTHPGPILEASSLLTGIYISNGVIDSAFKYQQIMLATKDSLFSQEKVRYIQDLSFNEEHRQQEMKAQQEAYRNKLKLYASIAIGIMLSAVAFILYRNNQHKQKAFVLLQQQKQETDLQKAKAEQTLEELKATQEQLIEQEREALENELKLQRATYQSRMVEMEMQALRAQMNPHFIFNCLNSVNRFILKNESEAASDYLTKFSKLIRLILQNSQSKTVTLENELESLSLYLEMEMLRFEGQFDYHISCHPDLEVEELEVPPLIIQPYVENAIWHGLMHKEGKGHISIQLQGTNQMLRCSIEDDGIGRKRAAELNSKSATKKKSLGMQITTHRLELLKVVYDKQPTVEIKDLVDASGESCGTRVVIEIPI